VLEKALELLVATWDYTKPGVWVDPSEGAGVLRLGKYQRTLGCGFHWKWPLIECPIVVTTCEQTLRLPPQTVTTSDGHTVTVAAIVRYEINDVKPYICNIFDQADVLVDVTMGQVRRSVTLNTYEALVTDPPESKVRDYVRNRVEKYGFKVSEITFTDLARGRSLRLIQSHPKDLNN
jgi:regulator of protease activity HflC (stomatin/prohibitin superfamily)